MEEPSVDLRRADHEGILRGELKELAQHEAYWNVMLFCNDGTLALNRLTVGLIFPQLQDEISVICPDYTMSDITDLINRTLCPLVWPAAVCEMSWASDPGPGSRATVPMHECVIDLEDDKERPEVHRDPLDQLCFDLAPYASKNFITEPSSEVEFVGSSQKTKVKPVDTIDLTQSGVFSPTKTAVKVELHDPLTDILEESSDDEHDYNCDDNMTDSLHHDSELHYTANEIMAQEILDSLIDNLEKDNKQYKARAYQSAQVLFYLEASEYMEEIDDDNGRKSDESLSIWDRDIDTGRKCDKDCVVEVEKLKLSYEDWSAINKTLGLREEQQIFLEKVKEERNEECSDNQCNECGKLFYDRHNLKRHMLAVHDRIVYSATPTQIQLINKTVEITPLDESKNESANRFSSGNPPTVTMVSRSKIRRNTATKSTTKPPRRCGNCRPCLVGDCRVCVYCLDMKKYGGKGVKKQKCLYRPTCQQFIKRTRGKSLPSSDSSFTRRSAPIRSPRTSSPVGSKSSRTSSPIVSRSLSFASPAVERSRREGSDGGLAEPKISAARQHLRDAESDSDSPRRRRKYSPRPSYGLLGPRGATSPFRLRVKDVEIDLKERLRRRAEGEWDRVKINSLREKQRKRTVSLRKVQTSSKDWPTKEELLFGFCVE